MLIKSCGTEGLSAGTKGLTLLGEICHLLGPSILVNIEYNMRHLQSVWIRWLTA